MDQPHQTSNKIIFYIKTNSIYYKNK